MRLKQPRIAPLTVSELTEEQRELLPPGPGGAGRPLNIFATLVRYPKLLKRWRVFGNHVLGKSSLPARERELLILRTGWLCNSPYEFHQHTRIGLAAGLTPDEIRRLTLGQERWQGFDRTLVRAADELHADQMLSDETWNALRERYSEQQVMDLLFAVGQYTLVSMVLNSLGVQTEDGSQGFPT